MTLQWYALRSKPNKEDALSREALACEVNVFYPQMRVQPKNPRARKMRPYFPGYLFVQLDLLQSGSSFFVWMPHSGGLVSFGVEPASVPDALIAAIRRRVDEINEAGGEQLQGLNFGDAVVIQDGPFAGQEAIFDSRISGNERVRILIGLLRGRQIPLELPSGQIERKKQRV